MRLVKPITRTRGSPANRSLTRSRSVLVASAQAQDLGVVGDRQRGLDGAGHIADTPAAAGDGDHGAVQRQARALRGRRARERGSRNAGEVGGLAQRTLPGPAIRSTSSCDSGWVMKCRSIPGCAQKRRPARSVIDE